MQPIRKAAQDDRFRLAEIEVTDYRLYFYPIFHSDRYFFCELTVAAVAEEYRERPERIERTFVYDDGAVKGFIRVNGEEIEKLFVEPAFWGQGIGGRLLEHALAHTQARRLLVLEKNERAIRFYRRHGFHTTEQRQPVGDTNEQFIVMER